ncbi:MAG: tetratricopeptide repeat protein [Planctomycetes bacterium]|nr:tetratricopeptide repeat protein [Planctomycetota bacterium]
MSTSSSTANAPSTSSRGTSLLVLLGVLFATACVYATILSHGLVYDDHYVVGRNPLITSFAQLPAQFGSGMWDMLEPVERSRVGYWRPLMNVALTCANVFGGGSPRAFHALSILLHLAATTGAFALALRLARRLDVAAFAALLFALHPVQVESVAWISASNSMLFGAFAFFALERHVAWRERGSIGVPWASGACFLLALLSKELALAVVPAALALDLFLAPGRADAPKLDLDHWSARLAPLRAWIPLGAAFLLYYVGRVLVFESALAGFDLVTTDFGVPSGRLGLLRVELLGGGLALLGWPAPLNLFRPVQPDLAAFDGAMLPAWGALLVCVAVALLAWAKREWMLVACVAIILLAVAPLAASLSSLGVFPLSDRYLYFAAFGFALALAWAAVRVLPRAAAIALLLVVAGVYGAQTYGRAQVWRDDATLLADAVRTTPDSPYVLCLYGRQQLDVYRAKAVDPTPGALEALRNAHASFDTALTLANRAQHGDGAIFALDSDFVQANVGYAWCLLYEAELDGYNDFETPLQVLENVVKRYPDQEAGHLARGVVLQRLGRFDDAEQAFQQVLTINPLFAEAWYDLGLVRITRGKFADAVQALDKALALRPDHLDYLVSLARAEAENGRAERALELLQRAQERYPDASSPLVWRATILAQKGQFDAAIELARRALELAPDDGDAHMLKGRLHARVNESAAAERAFTRAADLLPRSFEANYNAGAVLLQQKDLNALKAIPFLVKAYQLRPPGKAGDAVGETLRRLDIGAPDVLWDLASADAAREENASALDWIDRALARDAKHGPSHFLKAFLLKKKGDVAGAIENWTRACDELPESIPARTSLANALIEQQRFAEALKRLEEAQALVQKDVGRKPEAQDALEQLRVRIEDVRAQVKGR